MRPSACLSLLALLLPTAASCTRVTEFLRADGADAGRVSLDGGSPLGDGGASGAPSDASADAPEPPIVVSGGQVFCGSDVCACSNGVDDDLDGLIDGFDPECIGAFDADEAGFGTGAPGAERASQCQDCFYDANNGVGDDGCKYPAECLSGGPAPADSCGTCEPSARCIETCQRRAPNGCDCFGCCEIRSGGAVRNVMLNDRCSMSDLDDPVRCPVCQPNLACMNPCGPCELCLGKRIEDLPASCDESASGYTCDEGRLCSPASPCGAGEFCQQGCCAPTVL